MPGRVETRVAEWGSRMIEIRVRFWTDSLTEGRGRIRLKHAWSGGVVRMSPNRTHGITPKNPRPFNSIGKMAAVIERVLSEHGIKLHPMGRLRKIIAVD